MKRLLRLPVVEDKTGMKKTQIFQAAKAGLFPRPVTPMVNGRAVAWLEEEIDAYIDSRCAARDAEPRQRGRPPSRKA
jgi:prophage regulatory protein